MKMEIPDVVGGEIVESTWGNAIRDRTVQRYATEADRSAKNPTPSPGDSSFLEDQLALSFRATASWGARFKGTSATSVATPTYTFEADEDTGMMRVAANTVGIIAGGQKRFSVSDTIVESFRTTKINSNLYLDPISATTHPANLFIAEDGRVFKSTSAVLSDLRTLVAQLEARIETLEA